MVLIAAILVPVALIGAGVAAYLAGALNDDGEFRAEPPACATVAPSLHLLGTAYTAEEDGTNNCGLLLPKDHPRYVPSDTITVSYYVATPRRQDAPDAASDLLRKLEADVQPLSDVGDEAYLRNHDLFFRVSNLVVAIVAYLNPVSTDDQIRAFATDVADRLRES
jgi:hypothetical protein